MVQFDIGIEPDLAIADGDIEIREADDDNTLYIIFGQPGQLRLAPKLGVGIINFTNAPDRSGRDLAKKIRQEHERDGYKVRTLDLEKDANGNQELTVKAVKVRN